MRGGPTGKTPGHRRAPLAIPSDYAEELAARGRHSGLVIGLLAVVIVPLWSVFDLVLEPERASAFIGMRLFCELPLLLGLAVLWKHPYGRREPELVTFLMLVVVQSELAWIVVRAQDARELYLLGFPLALYGSGCMLVGATRWTAALVLMSVLAFAMAMLSAPVALPPQDLWAAGFYVATAAVIATVAHEQRNRLTGREFAARLRVEEEQCHSAALFARLEQQTREDALTGLANRRLWDTQLREACASAALDGSELAVVLIDVDRFKEINDRHGHASGDEALRQIGARLSRAVGTKGLVARIGGDELAVLLLGMDEIHAVEVAEQLRQDAVAALTLGDREVVVTLSLGVAAAAGADAHPAELMGQADHELYRAKRTRNAVSAAHLHDPLDFVPIQRPGEPTSRVRF